MARISARGRRAKGMRLCPCGREYPWRSDSICGRCRKHKNAAKHPERYRLDGVYSMMTQRCASPSHDQYANYGARGIKVCEEWLSSRRSFIEWSLSNGYSIGLQIDRIDNDGDYTPDNCRWVTPKENARNTRANHLVAIGGETKTIMEWSEIYQINSKSVWSRLSYGWSEHDAITRPIKGRS